MLNNSISMSLFEFDTSRTNSAKIEAKNLPGITSLLLPNGFSVSLWLNIRSKSEASSVTTSQ
jgi:hypothetical protein